MEPTTITSIVLVLLGMGILSMSAYTWFGSWQPEPRRISSERQLELEYRAAVREMREAIERYERGERSL